MHFVLAGFPAMPCFLCCRCGSAVTRAGWPGWSTSARVPCALQQPWLRCSAQRPSSSTLSGASSSPAIWRKEHDLLLCTTVLAVKGCGFFHNKICVEKGFHMCLEALIREWQRWQLPRAYYFVFWTGQYSKREANHFLFMHHSCLSFSSKSLWRSQLTPWHNLVDRLCGELPFLPLGSVARPEVV